MALPASATFTGSNGTAINSLTGWDGACAGAAGNGMQIINNEAQGITADHLNGSWWATDSFNNDHKAQAVVTSLFGGTYVGVGVRMSGTDGGSNLTAYAFYSDASDGCYIEKYVNGSYVATLAGPGTVFTVGDVILLEVQGNTLTGYVDGVQRLTVTDSSSPISMGAAGIAAFGNNAGRVDDWTGDNLAGAPGPITASANITLGALTLASTAQVPISAHAAISLGALTLSASATGLLSGFGSAAITLGTLTLSATATVPIQASAAITLGSLTLASTASSLTLSGACIGGVLRASSNPRYFENDTGILLFSGFHNWHTVADGGETDPPPVFDYDEWLDFQDARGGNIFKLWAMETPHQWPTQANFYFQPLPWARTGPGTAADGKARFDLTTFDPVWFERLLERAVLAGNRGYYVIVQFFQGWHIDDKGYTAGNPWLYHPMQSGNNINSIDGDTDNDDGGEETRDIDNTTIYTLQKAYVARVIDTLNFLDNILWEVSNEETGSANNIEWQYDLIAYIRSYEATLPKQHPVGMTWVWPNGDNGMLDDSDADWVSYGDNGTTIINAPLEWSGAEGVSFWDTDHMGGLVLNTTFMWRAFCQGHNTLFMDSYDGAYGLDWRADPDAEIIRHNLGYIRSWAEPQINLALATPQSELSETEYCLANTTSSPHQYITYQPDSGAFDLDLSATPGTLTLNWLRVSDGDTEVASDVTGGATRTLTPPWSGAVVARLAQTGVVTAHADIVLGALTLAASAVLPVQAAAAMTLGALTLAAAATVPVTAHASITLGALTLDATGAGVAMGVGSANILLGALTLAATATVPITASANITLGALTLSASSLSPITAYADILLGPLTLLATEAPFVIATVHATVFVPASSAVVYTSRTH